MADNITPKDLQHYKHGVITGLEMLIEELENGLTNTQRTNVIDAMEAISVRLKDLDEGIA